MKRISLNISLLMLFLLMPSCIKEELPECDETALQFTFRYTFNNQYMNLFDQEVERVTVYVFDAAGKYAGTYTQTGEILTNDYVMRIPMPAGNYHAVVFCDNLGTFSAGWVDGRTNIFRQELKAGETAETDFRIMLNSKEGADGYLIPEAIPGELYAGYAANVVASDDLAQVTMVDLMKDTKKIEVRISGLDILTQSATFPDIYITAQNGRYKSENSIDTSHRMYKFMPYTTSVAGNMVRAQLKTMRLIAGNAPTLVIKNPANGGILFNQDITKLILSNPKYKTQADIDREDSFLLEINLSNADGKVVISVIINGWKVEDVMPVNN